jgi:photosystem II stability/assembly factor-like uncharacterized protein
LVLVGLVCAASVNAALDPAHLETWNLPRASLYAVTSEGQNAWAVGYWGTVLRSIDSGKTWTETRTPTAKTLFGVSFADANTGWAVGAGGVVLRSTDAGVTWTLQPVQLPDEMGGSRPLDTNLFGVAALSPTEAIAVGDLGVVLRTRDGEHWEKVPLDAAVLADDNVPERIFNAVVFTSPTDGWIAGEFATLLRTTDGGNTWVGQRTIEGAPNDLYLFNLSAAPGGPAAAVGLAGSVIVSSEGGAKWESRSVDTSAGLFAIAWQGEQGVAVGDRGVLFVTQDGGKTWTDPKRPKLFNWLSGATFPSATEALVVGEGGLVLRSEDGGATWVAATTPSLSTEPPMQPLGGSERNEH